MMNGQAGSAEISDCLDLDALAELQDLLEDGFVELLHSFLADSDTRIAQSETQLLQADYGSLARTAHSLKGSALNIGAPGLAQCWSRLESAAGQSAPVMVTLREYRISALAQYTQVKAQLQAKFSLN